MYDGWETRRRRETGHDDAIVRLGVPGVIRGVVVDTAWFKGNYPPADLAWTPSRSTATRTADELAARPELDAADRTQPGLRGHPQHFEVDSDDRWTHVRLNIYPDGGVARLRVHGEGRPDSGSSASGRSTSPRWRTVAWSLDCSNRFYSPRRRT